MYYVCTNCVLANRVQIMDSVYPKRTPIAQYGIHHNTVSYTPSLSLSSVAQISAERQPAKVVAKCTKLVLLVY